MATQVFSALRSSFCTGANGGCDSKSRVGKSGYDTAGYGSIDSNLAVVTLVEFADAAMR